MQFPVLHQQSSSSTYKVNACVDKNIHFFLSPLHGKRPLQKRTCTIKKKHKFKIISDSNRAIEASQSRTLSSTHSKYLKRIITTQSVHQRQQPEYWTQKKSSCDVEREFSPQSKNIISNNVVLSWHQRRDEHTNKIMSALESQQQSFFFFFIAVNFQIWLYSTLLLGSTQDGVFSFLSSTLSHASTLP